MSDISIIAGVSFDAGRLHQARETAARAAIRAMTFEAPFKLKGDGEVEYKGDEDEDDTHNFYASFEKNEADDEDNGYDELLVEVTLYFAAGSVEIVRVFAQVNDGYSILDNRVIQASMHELAEAA